MIGEGGALGPLQWSTGSVQEMPIPNPKTHAHKRRVLTVEIYIHKKNSYKEDRFQHCAKDKKQLIRGRNKIAKF